MRNNVPTILIVEDDERIRNLMRTVLTGAGYATLETGKAATAVSMLASHSPDLMLLDLGLPDRDGQELLSDIRTWSSVPVVVVSARGQEKDKVRALDGGADDYITKPFGAEELLARIRAALRHGQRMAEGEKSVYNIGGLQVDTEKRIVRVDGREVHLTQIEYKIVTLLCRNAGKVLTHDSMIREVWGAVFQLRYAASARQHGQHPPQDRERPRHAGVYTHGDRRGLPHGRGIGRKTGSRERLRERTRPFPALGISGCPPERGALARGHFCLATFAGPGGRARHMRRSGALAGRKKRPRGARERLSRLVRSYGRSKQGPPRPGLTAGGALAPLRPPPFPHPSQRAGPRRASPSAAPAGTGRQRRRWPAGGRRTSGGCRNGSA